jgi:hypothetical protein
MLLEMYAGCELATAEHEERLREAANARLAARVGATRASPHKDGHADPSVPAVSVAERLLRLCSRRGSGAPAAFERPA